MLSASIKMKTEVVFIQALKREIVFYIGKTQSENFETIDKGRENDLCKSNTNKLKSERNVEIIYTLIKNVTKTAIAGCVTTLNSKTIIC